MQQKSKGLSLVELMVVVAVLAVIAGIGYPLYTEQVEKSRRYDAQGVLLSFGNALEQHRALQPNQGYAGFNKGDFASLHSQLDSFYEFDVVPGTLSYAVSAAPVAGSAQASDRCGTLTLNSQGVKGAAEGNCWK